MHETVGHRQQDCRRYHDWRRYHGGVIDPLLRRGIEIYNAGEFFESHEVLEEAWTPERGPRRLFLQSLIHVAVGAYQSSRGNTVGACRQLRKALVKMEPYLPEFESVDTGRLYGEVRELLAQIERGAGIASYPRMHAKLVK